VFGAIEVATVAYAEERGAVAATGWLLGLFALSSGLTGLYLGARPGRWSLTAQLLVGTAALTVAAASLPLLDTLAVYAVGMFASGLGVSAVLIGSLQIIQRAVPRSRLTESLAVAIAGIQVGFAAAAATAGWLIDRGGSGWGLSVGSAAAAAGLLLALAARRSLARAEAGPAAAPTPADRPGVAPGS
jgi:MFS family permease